MMFTGAVVQFQQVPLLLWAEKDGFATVNFFCAVDNEKPSTIQGKYLKIEFGTYMFVHSQRILCCLDLRKNLGQICERL